MTSPKAIERAAEALWIQYLQKMHPGVKDCYQHEFEATWKLWENLAAKGITEQSLYLFS